MADIFMEKQNTCQALRTIENLLVCMDNLLNLYLLDIFVGFYGMERN
jgi:hypothetical protein